MSPYYTNSDTKNKIDDILQKCASLFSNLGTNTSLDVKTVEKVKQIEQEWLEKIKELDPDFHQKVVVK
jgi:hypothetical protein